jgi:hypothetical protein
MAKNYLLPIPLSSIDSATFTGVYQLVTTLPNACLILRIINNSGIAVTISYDGVNAHDVVQTLSTLQINAQSNAGANNYVVLFRQGTPIYVLGATASTGLVYVAGYYEPIS